MPRIAIGGFLHETNTFAPSKATYQDFVHGGGAGRMLQGSEILAALGDVNAAISGAIRHGRATGWDLIPTIFAATSPSAHVTCDAFERIAGDLIDRIAAAMPLDGVFLDLHGAMVTEHLDDGEGELLSRLRDRIGPDVPVVVCLDLHANVTAEMFEKADLLESYRTYPHVDMAETGLRGARALSRMLDGTRPEKAMRVAPYLSAIAWQCTSAEPAKGLYAKMEALAGDSLGMSFNMGFPAADFPECQMTVLAYGEGADAAADAMLAAVEAAEPAFKGRVHAPDEGVAEAVRLAVTAASPVVIADTQDNPGAGAEQPGGRVGNEASGGQVDRRHRLAGEGQQHAALEPGAVDFQQVARAVVEDRADLAKPGAAGIDDLEPDQVGMVEFVIRQRGQPVTRRVEPQALQRVRRLLGGDAAQPCRQPVLDRTGDLDGEAAAAVLGGQRRVIGDRLGFGAEALQAHFAAHPEGSGNRAHAGQVRHQFTPLQKPRASTEPPASRQASMAMYFWYSAPA